MTPSSAGLRSLLLGVRGSKKSAGPPDGHSEEQLPFGAGRWTQLVSLEPDHYQFLYDLALESPDAFRWKFGSSIPPFDSFTEQVNRGSLAQYVVIEQLTGAPVGFVEAHGANPNFGHASIGMTFIEGLRGSGVCVEPSLQFINHLFSLWNLRKLYCHIPSYEQWHVHSLFGSLLKQEGHLRDHLYARGRTWDDLVAAIWRTDFEDFLLHFEPDHQTSEAIDRVHIQTDDSNTGDLRHQASTEFSPGTGLSGRHVKLLPVRGDHLDLLYRLAVEDEESFRWRFQGAQIPRDVFRSQLWPGVLCQFVVTTAKSGLPVGFVVAYQADLGAGHAYIGGMLTKDARRTGIGNEAFYLMFRFLRRTWNLKKLYFEFPEFNRAQFARGLGGDLRQEACYRDHVYWDGRYWDYHIFSYRY